MNPRGDVRYFFQIERIALEHQLEASLQRISALRARAAEQEEFSCAAQAMQLELFLLYSKRQLNKLQ